MKLSRRGLLLGAAALGPASLLACSQNPDQDSGTKAITVGLTFIPNVQFSPFYVAVAEGLFADAGLEVNIRHHGTQEGLFTALAAGDEQLVFASSDEAVVAATGELAGLRTFATCYQRYSCVVLADPEITELAQLRGRSLGVPGRYGSNWFATLAALNRAGLTEADIEITEIGWTQVTALTTGRVDAVVGFRNNEAIQLRSAGYEFTQLEIVDETEPNLVGPGLITLDGGLDNQVLAKLRDAILKAEQLIVDNPELALDCTATHVPTLADPAQRAQAAEVLSATAEVWHTTAGELSVSANAADFSRMTRFLVDSGIIEKAPSQTVIDLG